MLDQRGSKVRAIPAGEHHLSFWHLWILIADHLEFQIRGHAVERNGRMLAEISRIQSAEFFAAIADEVNRPPWRRTGGKRMRKFDDSRGSRGIVVSAVINGIAVYSLADSEMVEMGGEQNHLCARARLLTRQHANRVIAVAWIVLSLHLNRNIRSIGEPGEPLGSRRRKRENAYACIHGSAFSSGKMRRDRGPLIGAHASGV